MICRQLYKRAIARRMAAVARGVKQTSRWQRSRKQKLWLLARRRQLVKK